MRPSQIGSASSSPPQGKILPASDPRRSHPERAYFSDEDWSDQAVRHAIVEAFGIINAHLEAGHDVAIPADGLGTGLAELPRRGPRIHAFIEEQIARLSDGLKGSSARRAFL